MSRFKYRTYYRKKENFAACDGGRVERYGPLRNFIVNVYYWAHPERRPKKGTFKW